MRGYPNAIIRVRQPGHRDSAGRWRCGNCNRLCIEYELFDIVFADCRAGHYDVVDLGPLPPPPEPKPDHVQATLPGLA